MIVFKTLVVLRPEGAGRRDSHNLVFVIQLVSFRMKPRHKSLIQNWTERLPRTTALPPFKRVFLISAGRFTAREGGTVGGGRTGRYFCEAAEDARSF